MFQRDDQKLFSPKEFMMQSTNGPFAASTLFAMCFLTATCVMTSSPSSNAALGNELPPRGRVVFLNASRAAAATTLSETPAQADVFVDSIGADARFGLNGASEGLAAPQQVRQITTSGIRHLRDGFNTLSPAYLQQFRDFAGYGIHHSIGFAVDSLTPATILSALYAQMPYVDFVEVGNEWDHSGRPNWAQQLRAAQAMLYSTVRSRPEFSRVHVLAPGLESAYFDALTLGPVAADDGNLHNATCDFEPSTTIRSVNTIAELRYAQPITPGKPIYTTETGYDDDLTSSCYISPAGAAKYIPRTIAYRFNLGIPRSYFDYWSDESVTNNGFDRMGFVTLAGVPKPQYFAVKSLISKLADPGPPFRTAPLRYALSGATANVMHTLLQKRNGTNFLLIWLELPSWDHTKKIPIPVAPQTVTLTFPGSVGGVVAYSYGSDWSLDRSPLLSVFRQEITLNVTDSLTILQFGASN